MVLLPLQHLLYFLSLPYKQQYMLCLYRKPWLRKIVHLIPEVLMLTLIVFKLIPFKKSKDNFNTIVVLVNSVQMTVNIKESRCFEPNLHSSYENTTSISKLTLL